MWAQTSGSSQHNAASLDTSMLFSPHTGWALVSFACSLNEGVDEFSGVRVTKGGERVPDRNEAIMYSVSRNMVLNQSLCTNA